MIRQVVFCDICGTEKEQTNHWYVAYDQGNEFHVSGWSPSSPVQAGAKHLCGQNCLHKMLDEFLAAHMHPAGVAKGVAQEELQHAVTTNKDANLYSVASHAAPIAADTYIDEYESSARLVTPSETHVHN
jgi:hypothetical protein